MKDIILKVENLSKQYRLGNVGSGSLADDFKRFIYKIRGKDDPFLKIGETNDRSKKGNSDYVWALRDINFEVERGDVVGIIGRNGAGKSTLLKILSKVTGPITGSIKYNGKIASLLEVGTGFNGEMTGRENIFLNGAILGMTKKEIISKLDEIIEFSGCERYIDTPVKRYSSGMTVRLAFAVAAFLEPDILIVDEVLAVGDADFQKKAIGKMKDISTSGGRTVLFVSHNMASVKSLCTRAIVLENGKVSIDTDVDNAISYYLGKNEGNQQFEAGRYENDVFRLNAIEVIGKKNDDKLVEDDELSLITNITLKDIKEDYYHITYHLYNEMGEAMFSFSNSKDISLKEGENNIKCNFPASFFQSGQYFLSFFLVKNRKTAIFVEKDIAMFTVIDRQRELGVYMGKEPGYIKPQFKWEIIK
ncbi:ABC transporter ATP-binding protein [Polaribacter sp. MSW13]|uniref:ABC transporter ATP-binding protein n=1 Tax=Polaribacter marinus TaxID=2916838 RepID=A0A9X1VRU7_9FLAO|nr:ABC transporter ATP-binding protein [Polaribacter marinus]MCI2228376.1 ABC transporter ATP-binding protein [Polaribacter marinus]